MRYRTKESLEAAFSTPKLMTYPESVLKKRRRRVAALTRPHAVRVYEHLAQRSGNRKWRYICEVANVDSEARLANQRTGSFDVRLKFDPGMHDALNADVVMLRDLGVRKMHAPMPWIAFTHSKSLVVLKMVVGERLRYAYDIFDDVVLIEGMPLRYWEW